MEQFIEENQMLILYAFIGVLVAMFVISIVIAVRNKSKKKKYMAANKDLAEIIFDADILLGKQTVMKAGQNGHILHSLDGNDTPQRIGRSILVPAGPHTLDLEYVVSGQSLGTRHSNSFPREVIQLTVAAGGKYKVSYNLLDKKYEFEQA